MASVFLVVVCKERTVFTFMLSSVESCCNGKQSEQERRPHNKGENRLNLSHSSQPNNSQAASEPANEQIHEF